MFTLPRLCPACGIGRLHAVFDVDEVNLRCDVCRRCWHAELGYLSRVDPLACESCEYLERCVAVWQTDHRAGDTHTVGSSPSPLG